MQKKFKRIKPHLEERTSGERLEAMVGCRVTDTRGPSVSSEGKRGYMEAWAGALLSQEEPQLKVDLNKR